MKKINLSVKVLITLILTIFFSIEGNSQEIKKTNPVGIWAGQLDVQGTKLEIIFKITASEDGVLTAKLDVPVQGAKDLPVSKVSAENDSLIIVVEMINGNFKGYFKNDLTVEGKWSQSGFELPLTLTKTEKLPEINRPQNPQKPYLYVEEEVVYENKKAGIKLAGTLTLPGKEGKFPAVILITGSGAQDRDESLMGHKPFLVLADFLTRNGIAVLRVDDRGVGGSEGNIAESTSKDFANDVLAGVEFLKNHKSINSGKIGLIGHSEGGIIAPMVANSSKDIAFIVLWAGPGIVGEQIIYKQGELINRAAGATDDQIEQNRQIQKAIFDIILNEKDTTKIIDRLHQAFAGDNYSSLDNGQKTAIDNQIKAVNTPWFKFFLAYDPAPALTKVQCPVLALIGEKDLQVPAKANLEAIEKALTEGGNKKFKVMELKNLNHLFQNCQTGSIGEYGQIEETIAPEALNTIKDWILEVVR